MSRLIRVRVGRQPGPPVDPPPASWQDAFDTRNKTTMRGWYEDNTGHNSGTNAKTYAQLVAISAPTIDETWLSDNMSNDYVFTEGGVRVVEGVRCGFMRIRVGNLTVRNCLVTSESNNGGITSNVDRVSGLTIEHCTVAWETPNKASRCIDHHPDSSSGNIIRNNDLSGHSSGCSSIGRGGGSDGDTEVAYNWIHDLTRDFGHGTNLNIRAVRDCHVHHNLADGATGSASISMYANLSSSGAYVHNNLIEENLLFYVGQATHLQWTNAMDVSGTPNWGGDSTNMILRNNHHTNETVVIEGTTYPSYYARDGDYDIGSGSGTHTFSHGTFFETGVAV